MPCMVEIKLKFTKKSGDTLPAEDLVPGVDCDMLCQEEQNEQDLEEPKEPETGEDTFSGELVEHRGWIIISDLYIGRRS